MAYLLLTLSTNSKLNFPTLLLILHLVSNTMEQHKFEFGGLLYVDDLELMSTCLRTCLSGMEYSQSHVDQHTENKSHGFL